jgi:arylsulfatase
VPQSGAEGMIVTSGGRFAGYGFYLLKGKPVWLWNLVDLERIKWEGPDALPPGRHKVEFDFKYEGIGAGTLAFNDFSGLGRPGTGTLKVDGKEVATKRVEKTLPMILQWDESFDIGSDTLTGVNDADYKPPFPLTAKFNKLTIKVDRPQLSPADIKKLEAAMKAAGDGPVGEDLSLLQKIEMRFDQREECRKQADAKKLGPIERIGFVRECMK